MELPAFIFEQVMPHTCRRPSSSNANYQRGQRKDSDSVGLKTLDSQRVICLRDAIRIPRRTVIVACCVGQHSSPEPPRLFVHHDRQVLTSDAIGGKASP